MKLEEYIKRVIANSTPSIRSKHKKPMSRRELFAQGYLSMGACVAAPSLLSMLSTKAYGQECAPSSGDGSSMMPFLCVDLGGGANIPGANVIVGDRGGQMSFLDPGSYASLGLTPEAAPQNVSLQNELGLAFHPESRIFQGINSVLAPANAALVDGAVFCTSSNDDTRNNQFNPTYWIAKAGASGKVVSIVGTDDSVSGGRSMAPDESIDPSLRPALVQRPGDNAGLIVPGILADLVGTEGIQKIMKWTEGLSRSQLQRFDNLSIDEQTKTIVSCVYPNAIDQVTRFNANEIDPLQDDIINTVYDLNNGDDRSAGSVAKLLLDGYAGSGTVTLGGFDYHGNPRTTTDARDLRAGQVIGKFFEAAARKGKSAVVYCYTDGGVSCRSETPDAATPGRFNPSSDSGQRSAAFMLVYHAQGTARPGLRVAGRRQIGGFKASGGVDNEATLISNSVPNLAKAVVANYLALHGMEGDLSKVLTQDPFGADLEQYLIFNQIVSKT